MAEYQNLLHFHYITAQIPCQAPSRRKELIEQEAREGKLEGVEVHYRRKDGTTFVGLLSTRRVEGDNGETTYFDGAITDITERERRREALQERQTKIEWRRSTAPAKR